MFFMLVFYVCVFLCAASCVINDDDDDDDDDDKRNAVLQAIHTVRLSLGWNTTWPLFIITKAYAFTPSCNKRQSYNTVHKRRSSFVCFCPFILHSVSSCINHHLTLKVLLTKKSSSAGSKLSWRRSACFILLLHLVKNCGKAERFCLFWSVPLNANVKELHAYIEIGPHLPKLS